MAMTKLWKFLRNIQDLNWGQGVEVTKTGAEAAKAVLDLAKAIKEQKPNVQNFKPYLEQISSLLDVFNSPLGQITKEVIPFAPIAITILKFIIDATNKEPSLENCVLLVSQAAYIDSFQDILKQDSELLNKIDQNLPASHALALQIQKLGEQEFDARKVKKGILYFHESQLAESFNQILQQRLQEAGLSEAEAKTFTERVARHTDEYMQDALVEVGEKADKLWKWYSTGGKEKLEKNLNIEDYLEQVIKPKPEENIFDETDITFRDLYVPLQVKELDAKDDANLELEAWVKAILNDPNAKHKQVLFIQGEAGRGKSVFCRMFADWVQRELHPSFTPILIRLRDLRVLKDNLTDTLENYLQHLDFVTSDSGWLTDKNTRFLFLLDGFDELLLEGRASGGLKEFLEQVEQFQKDPFCRHQFLITGRPLALQGIERLLSQTKSLKRVELQPMDDSLRQKWLEKWAVAAQVNKSEYEEFLHQLDSGQFDSQRLLRIIGYSHCLGISAFRDNLGLFIRGANFKGADLSYADLNSADLRGIDFSNAYLTLAYLSRTNLTLANLTLAYLRGADLSRAILNGANLSRAILNGADFSEAILNGANLSRANLSDANLSDADLSRANLSRANLSRVCVSLG
ncbi:MAG: pentapeptide repeat-containing protein [Nostoc sp.]|uniref:pentapeptide repeat-containing protein n=1 Tax=Nostoc sp. TaxID=1180 RepID=UPI002FFC8AC2